MKRECSFDSRAKWRRIAVSGLLLGLLAAGCAGLSEVPNPGRWNWLAIESGRRQSWGEAEYWWRRMIAENPEDIVAWNNLAVALEAQDRFEEALAAYQHALEMVPGQSVTRDNYNKMRALLTARSAPAEEEETP